MKNLTKWNRISITADLKVIKIFNKFIQLLIIIDQENNN